MFVTYLAVFMTNVSGVTTDTMVVEEDTVEEDTVEEGVVIVLGENPVIVVVEEIDLYHHL